MLIGQHSASGTCVCRVREIILFRPRAGVVPSRRAARGRPERPCIPFHAGPRGRGARTFFFSGRGSVSCVVVGRGGAQVAGGSPVASLDQNEPFVRRIRMGTRRRTPMNQQERVLFQLTRRLQAVSKQGALFHGNFGTVWASTVIARRSTCGKSLSWSAEARALLGKSRTFLKKLFAAFPQTKTPPATTVPP